MEKKCLSTQPNRIMKCDTGSVTGIGIILSIFCSVLLLHAAASVVREYKRRVELKHISLCSKKLANIETTFVTQINKLNWLIANATKLQIISALFPALALGSETSLSTAKQTMKNYQRIILISYLKNLLHLKGQHCPISVKALESPYQKSGFEFKRDSLGRAMMKGNKWSNKVQGPNVQISIEFHCQNSQSWEVTKKGWLNWKISSGYY